MSRLSDPKVLMAIKDLQLAAKTTVDGFMAGLNKTNVKGPGLEFSQYRSYQPGDDLRWLDWKMYARSDRYFIRESEMETSISIRFLIDASSSMNHKDNGIAKIEYARYLAASLGYLAHLQGDAIGLYVFTGDGLFSLASKKDPQHLSRFFYQLENIKPEGKFTRPLQYKHIFNGDYKRELLVFITDFYEEESEISKLLSALSSLRHEIIVFHILGKNEFDLEFGEYSTLQDLETGKTISINNVSSKKEYQDKLDQHLDRLRKQLLKKKIFYRLIRMDQPLGPALRDFLNQRQKSPV